MRDVLRDAVLGFSYPDPARAPPFARFAFGLWRLSVAIVPALLLAAGFAFAGAVRPPTSPVGAALPRLEWGFLGAFLVALALPLGLLVNWTLGRALRGAARTQLPGFVALGVAAAVTVGTAWILARMLGDTAMPLYVLAAGALALVPATAFLCLTRLDTT